ncbi:hypothetical protein MCGE09_00601, partial [Thaumarchaeota archaeon SCGC AB-539-E09]
PVLRYVFSYHLPKILDRENTFHREINEKEE